MRIPIRVGHHDDCSAVLIEFRKQFHDFDSVFRIEVPGRLICEDQFGIGDHRSRDGDPLLLPSGKLLWEVLGPVSDLHAFEHGIYLGMALGLVQLEVDQRQFDVFKDGELIDQIKTLEDESQVAFAQMGALAFLEFGHLVSNEVVAAF